MRNLFILIFLVSGWNLSYGQGHSCLICKGSGKVYVERKVHTGYNTTWTESEVFYYKKTEKAYTTEGSYETCGRCNGTGYIRSAKPYVRKLPPVPGDFRGRVKHHYESKNIRGIPIDIKPTGVPNIYQVNYEFGGNHTEYLRRDGNKFYVLADKEVFTKATIIEGMNSDLGIAITIREYVDNNGFRSSRPRTMIYDQNGKYRTDFIGSVYSTGTDMIWKSEGGYSYSLHSFPGMKPLSTKSFEITKDSEFGKFYKQYGFIDVRLENRTMIINREGEYLGPRDQKFIGVDMNAGYLYFMDQQRFVNAITPNGQLLLPSEPQQRNCGDKFDCLNLDLLYIPVSKRSLTVNAIEPVKLTTVRSDLRRLNNRSFVNMSEFDKGGWATFQLLFNEYTDFLINKNSATAFHSKKNLSDYYTSLSDYTEISIDQAYASFEKNRPADETALTTYTKKGMTGGEVNWQGKEKKFKPKYKSLKIYYDNLVIFQEAEGKFGFYIKKFRDGSDYLSKAIYDKAIPLPKDRILVKQNGEWFYVQKYGRVTEVNHQKIESLKNSKYDWDLEDYANYKPIIEAADAGFDAPEKFTSMAGIDISEIRSVAPVANNPFSQVINFKDGKKKILHSSHDKKFIFTVLIDPENLGFPSYITDNTLILPVKDPQTGKFFIKEIYNDGRGSRNRKSQSFLFDEILYLKDKNGNILSYGKNGLGIFTFTMQKVASSPGGKKNEGLFPTPVILFEQ